MGSSNSFSASSVVASARGVYFNPEADSATAPGHEIEDGDLKSRMLDLIEGDEDIEDITIYSSQLMDGTVGGPLRFHAYVVIKTENWWWSLERIGEGTTIQRSKIKKYVTLIRNEFLRTFIEFHEKSYRISGEVLWESAGDSLELLGNKCGCCGEFVLIVWGSVRN